MKKIILLYCAIICLCSCNENFLDLAPQHELSESTFFQTEEHFSQALNGAYAALRGTTSYYSAIMGEMRSDNTHYIRYEADRAQAHYEEVADFINDELNAVTDDMYYNCYVGISRVNTILDRLENVDFDETFVNSISGEAKFLRAYYYFRFSMV